MNSPANARDRVFAAADTLYEESGRKTFPTVDAVRKQAKVNMNDASTGMREWRTAQTAPIATLPDPMPPALQRTIDQALRGMWAEAASLANETLRAAQTAWDRERLEAETLREQIASAYECQTAELESAQSEVLRLRHDAECARADLAAAQDRVAESKREAAAAILASSQARARMVEIEKRAEDLRKELDHRRSEQSATAQQLAAQRITLDRAIAEGRDRLEALRQQCERRNEELRNELSESKEQNAALRGELQALNTVRNSSIHKAKLGKPAPILKST